MVTCGFGGRKPRMDLLLATIWLRPYVFLFLLAFLAAAVFDLGFRRMLIFGGWIWALAVVTEISSTRTGIPFGLYHYTGVTRGHELYIADVPFMDSLSFPFLAYAAFCLARAVLARRAAAASSLAVLSGLLMMLLDVVIDPAAVRGDRWFLGRIFYYPHGGAYFGVPLSNFAGWWIVGTLGVAGYLRMSRGLPRPGSAAGGATGETASTGGRPGPGIALYYAVLGFNLVVTAWIAEWMLAAAGTLLHAGLAVALWTVTVRPVVPRGLSRREIEGA